MPKLSNQTPYAGMVVPLIDKDGRNVPVLIAKGTYLLDPQQGLLIAPEQMPILFADEYVGQPGQSDIIVPADLVDYKPSTDVIVIRPRPEDSARFQDGRKVSVELGPVRFSGRLSGRWPFGPLRRDESPRKRYAGTYDQDWIDNRMPLLPVDFDPRHNQAAPAGQISPQYLHGDEQLKIANLYQDGQTISCLLPGKVLLATGNILHHYFTELAVLDTVLIWSQCPMITLVWRHPLRVRQKIEEAERVQIYLIRRRSARDLFGGA